MTDLISAPLVRTDVYEPSTGYAGRRYKGEAVPPAWPSTTVTGTLEPGAQPHSVITLRVAVTRDTLAAVLDMAVHQNVGVEVKEDLDAWPVEDIHATVQMLLSVDGHWEYEKGAHAMYESLHGLDDGSMVDYAQEIYRTVDRAYPELAHTATLHGGPCGRAVVRCSYCDRAEYGSVDEATGRVLDHFQDAHR